MTSLFFYQVNIYIFGFFNSLILCTYMSIIYLCLKICRQFLIIMTIFVFSISQKQIMVVGICF